MAHRTSAEIGAEFNIIIRKLLKMLEVRSRSELELAGLERLGKRMSLLVSTAGPDALLVEAAPFFINFSERILERNTAVREQFFMSLDVRSEYLARGKTIDTSDEFIIGLADSIKKHWLTVGQIERDAAYADVKALLKCSAEYMLGRART